jgi:hypothetical protein
VYHTNNQQDEIILLCTKTTTTTTATCTKYHHLVLTRPVNLLTTTNLVNEPLHNDGTRQEVTVLITLFGLVTSLK